jgi:hypothetical protein
VIFSHKVDDEKQHPPFRQSNRRISALVPDTSILDANKAVEEHLARNFERNAMLG